MLKLSHALVLTVATDEFVRLMPSVDTARLSKALRLAAEKQVEFRPSLGTFVYYSPRCPEHPYVIDLARALRTQNPANAYCTCPDHVEREQVCKHIICAWLVNRVDEILSAAMQLQTISNMDVVDRYVQWAFGKKD